MTGFGDGRKEVESRHKWPEFFAWKNRQPTGGLVDV
jgi:hypothetical protein